MKLMFLIAAFFAVAAQACPSLEKACMNEENFAKCQGLEDDGCQNLMIMESCPLQFRCGD
jgi:hypothetical protein